MTIITSGGGSLAHLHVLYMRDGMPCPLYTLEVGCKSGLVCLEYERDGYRHYHPVTHLCDQMPECVQAEILRLFGTNPVV